MLLDKNIVKMYSMSDLVDELEMEIETSKSAKKVTSDIMELLGDPGIVAECHSQVANSKLWTIE